MPETVYRYDDAGRLVSSVTESEWDEEQQTLMLALDRCRELACKGCGGWLPETTDKAAAGKFVPERPVRCHRCDGFAMAAETAKGMGRPESLLLQVRKRG